MNHTIKSIIIVVVITSVLLLGATTTVPIMQNASARSTNTNSNTNTADSTSSSSATADNTNNIDNTATASNSQEQSACAVALTCPEGTTTVTPPPQGTGTLVIQKVCDTSCPDTGFPITVTGNNPVTPSSFTLSDGQTQSVTLGSGSFTVHESPGDFTPHFREDCVQTAPRSPDATGTITAGQTLHCTIINEAP